MTSADDAHQGPPPTAAPGRSGQMPLGARRLLLIGGLAILGGLLTAPYLFGLQLLAVGGAVTVAVGLAYKPGTAWFAGWARLTAAAGGLWAASTIAYWATVVGAAETSAQLSDWSPALRTTGAAFFVIMAAAVAAATLARFRLRRAGRAGQ